MRMITTSHVTSALLAIALSLPVAAWAQTITVAATTQAAGSQRENVEQRIADMHATLQITAAQETQFNEFAQVMLDNAQAMQALLGKTTGSATTQSAVEILQGYLAVAQRHAQDVQKLSAAFGTLYASLTPEQQKAADEMFRSSTLRREQKQGG